MSGGTRWRKAEHRVSRAINGKRKGATQSAMSTLTKREWIAGQAREHPERVFTSLNHLIDLEWMIVAYQLTRKDGAVGVDGVTAAEYEENLESNLEDLLSRMKTGQYKAPAVRRHYIPKADGTVRPLGIPTFEDKVAQRAVLMMLESIYEENFLECSYGFRPGRGAHGALDAIWVGVMKEGQRWVIDADIRKYFDSIDHTKLREFLDLRIKDGVIRRMIDKWLKAGVLEEGQLTRAEEGTPQGGVISPLISNLYLHHVIDKWFEETVKPRMKGRCRLVRYADDFVMLFEEKKDGERVYKALGKRLEKYGLTLHETKTRYVDMRPGGKGEDHRFDFLGFTHVWGRSRKGNRVLRKVTAKDRYARAVSAVNEWCKRNRHLRIDTQAAHLGRVIHGHCNYYGVTGNGKRLSQFRYQVTRAWRKWLSRRSSKGWVNWEKMKEILRRNPLPSARVVRSIYVT